MEEFFQALGTVGLIFLVVVGALAGAFASWAQGGRDWGRNVVIGIVGAVALPFILAFLAAGLVAAGGLLLILFVAAMGAVVVLLIAKLIFD